MPSRENTPLLNIIPGLFNFNKPIMAILAILVVMNFAVIGYAFVTGKIASVPDPAPTTLPISMAATYSSTPTPQPTATMMPGSQGTATPMAVPEHPYQYTYTRPGPDSVVTPTAVPTGTITPTATTGPTLEPTITPAPTCTPTVTPTVSATPVPSPSPDINTTTLLGIVTLNGSTPTRGGVWCDDKLVSFDNSFYRIEGLPVNVPLQLHAQVGPYRYDTTITLEDKPTNSFNIIIPVPAPTPSPTPTPTPTLAPIINGSKSGVLPLQ